MSEKEVKSKKTKKDGKKKTHRKLKKPVAIVLLAILVLCVIGAGVLFGVIFGLIKGEWSLKESDLEIEFANSTILDMDGNLIGTLSGDENRIIISKDEMSQYLPQAFISIEDERFESHNGIDLKRTFGAILNFVTHSGSSSYGGSTITQQCIKNLTNERDSEGMAGALRKIKEMARAYQLEQIYSKDQIIELYLNLIPLGGGSRNLCGVEMAARYYFNKPAKELTVVESAYLAGITNAPNTYNPFGDYPYGTDEAKTSRINKRVTDVCYKMNQLGRLSDDEYQSALTEIEGGIKFEQGTTSSNTNHSYHTEAAIKQIINDLMEKNKWSEDEAKLHLYGGGYTIYTTQDTDLQKTVEEAYKNPKWITTKTVTREDEDGKKVKETVQLQSGMVIMDHSTGYVVAGAGALGEKAPWGTNRMLTSGQLPGSSIKPLAVIAPSLQEGLITAATVVEDSPVTYGSWTPKNDKGQYGGLMNIRSILRVSRNIPEVKMMDRLTVEKSSEYLKSFGLTTLGGDEGLSLALGAISHGAIPLEMAGAYSTIANYGVYIEPAFYTKVESSTGKILIQKEQETHRVISEQNAWILQSLLTEPTGTGLTGTSGATATGAALKGYQTCGKTGTTNNTIHTWFCGFTPYYTATMYFGYDDQTVGKSPVSSGDVARRWASIMKVAHEGLEAKRFDRPSGITTAQVCSKSGLLASELCINSGTAYTEYFVSGTVPKSSCESHNSVLICSETNLLASEGCPHAVAKFFTKTGGDGEEEQWTTTMEGMEDPLVKPTEYCPHEKTVDPTDPGENDDPENPTTPGEGDTPNPDNPDNPTTPGEGDTPNTDTPSNTTTPGNGNNTTTPTTPTTPSEGGITTGNNTTN